MLHTLYIDALCYKVSVHHMTIVLDLIFMVQGLFGKKVKIFCNVNVSLIMRNRITLFGMCIPCKILMPVSQFSLDLDLISWISEQD